MDRDELICNALDESDPIKALDALLHQGIVDERDIGAFIADNADEAFYHPHVCEGFAFIAIGNGRAISAAWDGFGFWCVDTMTLAEARAEIEARSAEIEDSEED